MTKSDALLYLLLRWEALNLDGKTPNAQEVCRDPELLGEFVNKVEFLQRFHEFFAAEQGPLEEALAGGTENPAPETPAAFPEIPGYVVLEKLGEGGMGLVYRVHEPVLNRHLALKMLSPEHRHRADSRRRFIEEAQIASQLQHPGIAPIHELGTLPDGRPFFTMRLIEGRTLAQLLKERPHPAANFIHFLVIFQHICEALAHAHARHVIHRDLKPANVMVGAYGEIQLMDWGLGKVVMPASADTLKIKAARALPKAPPSAVHTTSSSTGGVHTEDGWIMGTLAYMAPEQALGDNTLLDMRSDVFGLGAILCEILTGEPPYVGSSAEIKTQVQQGKLAPAHARLKDCGQPRELILLGRRCLRRRPEDRPDDASQVAEAVRAFMDSLDSSKTDLL